MTHIIIARSHPLQYYGIRLLFIIAGLALLRGAYEMGYMQSEEDIIKEKGGRNSLLLQQKILKKRNKELSREILHLERKFLLEQKSCEIIKSDMTREQEKILALEQQVDFYKGIIVPSEGREKIYLQSLEITPILPPDNLTSKAFSEKKAISGKKAISEKRNYYQYRFIIAQKMKKRTYTKGAVKIFINGLKNNKPVRLSLRDLTISNKVQTNKTKTKEQGFKYNFKYFQEFSGIIALPEDMKPRSTDVVIDSKKKKSKIELRDLSWSENEGIKYVGK